MNATAIKLTKTERKILMDAYRAPAMIAAAVRSSTATRGRASEGTRATRALCGLRDKGLVGPIASDHSVECHRGIVTHYTELTAKVTSRGLLVIRGVI